MPPWFRLLLAPWNRFADRHILSAWRCTMMNSCRHPHAGKDSPQFYQNLTNIMRYEFDSQRSLQLSFRHQKRQVEKILKPILVLLRQKPMFHSSSRHRKDSTIRATHTRFSCWLTRLFSERFFVFRFLVDRRSTLKRPCTNSEKAHKII